MVSLALGVNCSEAASLLYTLAPGVLCPKVLEQSPVGHRDVLKVTCRLRPGTCGTCGYGAGRQRQRQVEKFGGAGPGGKEV